MHRSLLIKAAAILCSAVSLAAVGLYASAAETVREVNRDNYPELEDGVINFVATKVVVDEADVAAAADGYVVHYDVELANNPGFISLGAAIHYDERLTPVMNDGYLVFQRGEAGGSVGVVKENENLCRIGWGAAALDPIEENGRYLTVDLKLPADAKAGDKYEITWDVEGVNGADDVFMEYNVVNGYIEIVGSEPDPDPAVDPDPVVDPDPAVDPDPVVDPDPAEEPQQCSCSCCNHGHSRHHTFPGHRGRDHHKRNCHCSCNRK